MKKWLMWMFLTACIDVVAFTPSDTSVSWEEGFMDPIESQIFNAAKYEPNRAVLTLIFNSGAVYEYYGVSRNAEDH